MVNLGGGYPVRYRDEIPGIDRFADAIMHAMTQHFGNDLPEILVEPGRFLVGDAGRGAARRSCWSATRRRTTRCAGCISTSGASAAWRRRRASSIKYRFQTPHDAV